MTGEAGRNGERAAALGLLAAWIVHDLEEVVAMPGWARSRLPELRRRHPSVPDFVWRQLEVDGREFALAVGVMGGVVAAASVDGVRTGGRSAVFQAALTGFGLHGVVHLAQAALARGYTPGSVTSGLVVIPYTLWARAQLQRRGVLRPARASDAVLGLGLAAAAIAGAHAVSRALLRKRRRRSRRAPG